MPVKSIFRIFLLPGVVGCVTSMGLLPGLFGVAPPAEAKTDFFLPSSTDAVVPEDEEEEEDGEEEEDVGDADDDLDEDDAEDVDVVVEEDEDEVCALLDFWLGFHRSPAPLSRNHGGSGRWKKIIV